ncbi:MAG TPA: glucose-6-phosphate dehydrogenase assembly protein OpcA [Bryobacteraceae bacterium]
MSAAVTPDRILKELADLWVSLGKPGQGESGAGVLRACSMTLVVLAEASDDTATLDELLAALMPEHPARTVIVRLSGAGERTLADRVYAQCWMPFGQRRQICCEQIEITASDAALVDLPSVVLPVAAADLPVIVWSRSGRLAQMPEFRSIARMATKAIVDSGEFPNAVDALWQLADLSRRGLRLGDLAWTRLTRWREALARVFENRQYGARLGSIHRVTVEFGRGLETSAWYMAAWISGALADVGVKVETIVTSVAGIPLRVELEAEAFRVRVGRAGDRLVVETDGYSSCTSMPQPSEYALMREELGIVRPDAVYEKTLAASARLAYSAEK